MLPEIDYDSLNDDELRAMRRRIDVALESYQRRKIAKAAEELEQLAKQHGVTLDEVLNARTKRQPGKGEPKYRNPFMMDDTWSGRGRKPKWLVEGLAAGKSLSDFEI